MIVSGLHFHFLAALILLLLASVTAPWATGHPNHDAVAEVDWNPESKSLEVALQVTSHELERALSEKEKKAVDLDDKRTEPMLKSYVDANVRLTGKDGNPVKMSWVGAEIKVRTAWLYFEFPLGDAGPIGCELSNTVFFERHEDQKNTVALKLKDGEPRRFLRFSKEEPTVRVGEKDKKKPAKEQRRETT